MRRKAKVDLNHAEIRDGLRQLGFSVLDLSRVGHGCPDLLVGGLHIHLNMYCLILVEVKQEKGKLTPEEETFFEEWKDYPRIIARDIEDVLEWFSDDKQQRISPSVGGSLPISGTAEKAETGTEAVPTGTNGERDKSHVSSSSEGMEKKSKKRKSKMVVPTIMNKSASQAALKTVLVSGEKWYTAIGTAVCPDCKKRKPCETNIDLHKFVLECSCGTTTFIELPEVMKDM